MSMGDPIFLVIEKGAPYRQGEVIPLAKTEISVGRAWEDHHPDIAFSSLYVSRRHAVMMNRGRISELLIFPESKTETKINQQLLEKGVVYRLNVCINKKGGLSAMTRSEKKSGRNGKPMPTGFLWLVMRRLLS